MQKGYLAIVNYRLFSKVKINSVILLERPFAKFLYQVWFRGFSVDYVMNPITENVLDTLLSEVVNILAPEEVVNILAPEEVVNIFIPETLKYWVGVERGQSYLMGRRCLFRLGRPPF